jgi:hypothetical protein
MERHNVVNKWETGFSAPMASHCFQVENGKYVWVFVTPSQPEQLVKTSALYDGPVYTVQELIENERVASPDTYQTVCMFLNLLEEGAIKPYWTNNSLSIIKCECGSEKVYGNTAGHSSWCPKC